MQRAAGAFKRLMNGFNAAGRKRTVPAILALCHEAAPHALLKRAQRARRWKDRCGAGVTIPDAYDAMQVSRSVSPLRRLSGGEVLIHFLVALIIICRQYDIFKF